MGQTRIRDTSASASPAEFECPSRDVSVVPNSDIRLKQAPAGLAGLNSRSVPPKRQRHSAKIHPCRSEGGLASAMLRCHVAWAVRRIGWQLVERPAKKSGGAGP